MNMRTLLLPLTSIAVAYAMTIPAKAEEVTLRAISAFQIGTKIYEPFETFVKNVNENGKGIVQIKVIGGPDAMPPFEIGNALRGGVIDLANTTAVYHANLVPEGLAMTLTNQPMTTLRSNGGYALLNEIHEKKANIHWLGRLLQNVEYHIYLSKFPETLKFEGLKIRSAPTYQAFFNSLGISPLQTAAGEVFTALERGTIDGYAWPSIGVFDLGWQEKTDARVDPGFYQVETGVYFSGNVWKKLTDEQREFLQNQMLKFEANAGVFAEQAKTELKKQEEFGIKAYTLPEAEAKTFIEQSQEAGWKPVLAANPTEGAKLKELFSQ